MDSLRTETSSVAYITIYKLVFSTWWWSNGKRKTCCRKVNKRTYGVRVPRFSGFKSLHATCFDSAINHHQTNKTLKQLLGRVHNIILHYPCICLRYMPYTRVGTLIVATIYLQLIQNRYMFRRFTLLQCSHQHCVQPVVSDVEVVGYL